MLQGWDLNSRDTRDMKNNMEARTYTHTHIVLAKVQYEENRPAHLVLHTRDKQLKSAPHAGHQSMCCHIVPFLGGCQPPAGVEGGASRPSRHSSSSQQFCASPWPCVLAAVHTRGAGRFPILGHQI